MHVATGTHPSSQRRPPAAGGSSESDGGRSPGSNYGRWGTEKDKRRGQKEGSVCRELIFIETKRAFKLFYFLRDTYLELMLFHRDIKGFDKL